MPGPGYWLEPHPWGCLEHPWSLRSGTLRAQEPASLHFVRIVSFHKIPSFSLFSQTLSLSSCGSAQAEEPCYLSSTDLSLPYPYCCPRSICPARLDVHTNLIDTGHDTFKSPSTKNSSSCDCLFVYRWLWGRAADGGGDLGRCFPGAGCASNRVRCSTADRRRGEPRPGELLYYHLLVLGTIRKLCHFWLLTSF